MNDLRTSRVGRHLVLVAKRTWFGIFNLLSYVVPKRRGLYAFLPLHDRGKFAGSLRELAVSYSARNGEASLDLRWIAESDVAHRAAREAGLRSMRVKTLPFWTLLRAEVVLIDTSSERFRGRFDLVQVWHESGFKKVGIGDRKYAKSGVTKLSEPSNYRLLLATSDEDARRKRASFPGANVVVTGSPRNDVFFRNQDRAQARNRFGLEAFDLVCTYAPTWRDVPVRQPLSPDAWRALSDLMVRTNAVFVTKRHPYDDFVEVPDDLPNVVDLTEAVDEVQELLLATDVLVSDYSGIVVDFCLTKRPIVYYTYDMDEYLKDSRDMHYDLTEVLPGPFCTEEQHLLNRLDDLAWSRADEYVGAYEAFVSRFHRHHDGRSSQRAWDRIRSEFAS